MSPVVDLRLWHVDRVAPALARMASGRRHLHGRPGLRFAKLLGTGRGRTFTVGDADPHHWALLTVWDDTASADGGPDPRLLGPWDDAATESLRVRMTPLTSRGRWSGQAPFDAPPGSTRSHTGPVAAITRARLRPTRAVSFWRAVPPVVADVARAPGLRLAIGVGEAPVLLQGTFTLWDSDRALTDFAYRTAAHRDVVARTEPARWYAEDLFARLAVHEVTGTYRGGRP
ncbi:monooxygenase [Nocardioides rubriscoriae]|uniref:monooxygenase n=1 Tax=Nocardioides rubriscoriae TaxID=642762 RepID=UPI0011DF7B75|nr:monooxygenase [Nocardioides rubriscoriae]